jgi:ELWxxDGT repeat protein
LAFVRIIEVSNGGNNVVPPVGPNDPPPPLYDNLTPALGTLFYNYRDGTSKLMRLWRADPDSAQTSTMIYGGDETVRNIANAGDKLLFLTSNESGRISLWISDGTIGGTHRVTTVSATNAGIKNFVGVGDQVFFEIIRSDKYHPELWMSDGTSDNTRLVTVVSNPTGDDFWNPTDINGTVFFGVGNELWRTDGTADGTSSLAASIPSRAQWSEFDDELYFAGGTKDQSDLWRTDGTQAGTERVKDSDSAAVSFPTSFAVLRGKMYFLRRTRSTVRNYG